MSVSKRDLILAAFISEIDGLLIMYLFNTFFADSQFNFFVNQLWWLAPILGILGIIIADYLKRFFVSFWQLAKFLLIGSLNVLLDLSIVNFYQVLFSPAIVNAWYPLVISFSFCVGTTNSYFWNKFWTFEKRDSVSVAKEVASFYLVAFIGYFLKVVISSYLAKGINPLFGMELASWNVTADFLGSLVVFAWNFLGYKFIVFKK